MRRILKNHFIPHEGNNYRPHLLQKAAMLAMVVMVLMTFTIANLQAVIWVNVDWLVGAVLPAVVISETNDERADGNLSSVTRSTVLDQAAQRKAEHMARNGYFAHYAPDGTSPWYWFNQSGYSFVHAGENLAVHFNDSKQVVEAWMDSPTHRANIMNGNYTEIGIGVAEGEYEGYDTVFVVQLFGTPARAETPVATNTASAPAEIVVVTEQVTEPVATVSDTETVASANESVEVVSEPEPVYELPSTTAAVEEEVVVTAATTTPASTTSPIDRFSGFISTSTNGIPATIDTNNAGATEVSTAFSFATQPQQVLQFLYAILALFILTALTFSIVLEFKRQQPLQIAYSFGLLALMGGLYYIHSIAAGAITIV